MLDPSEGWLVRGGRCVGGPRVVLRGGLSAPRTSLTAATLAGLAATRATLAGHAAGAALATRTTAGRPRVVPAERAALAATGAGAAGLADLGGGVLQARTDLVDVDLE